MRAGILREEEIERNRQKLEDNAKELQRQQALTKVLMSQESDST
jgi:hypothetical protein